MEGRGLAGAGSPEQGTASIARAGAVDRRVVAVSRVESVCVPGFRVRRFAAPAAVVKFSNPPANYIEKSPFPDSCPLPRDSSLIPLAWELLAPRARVWILAPP